MPTSYLEIGPQFTGERHSPPRECPPLHTSHQPVTPRAILTANQLATQSRIPAPRLNFANLLEWLRIQESAIRRVTVLLQQKQTHTTIKSKSKAAKGRDAQGKVWEGSKHEAFTSLRDTSSSWHIHMWQYAEYCPTGKPHLSFWRPGLLGGLITCCPCGWPLGVSHSWRFWLIPWISSSSRSLNWYSKFQNTYHTSHW